MATMVQDVIFTAATAPSKKSTTYIDARSLGRNNVTEFEYGGGDFMTSDLAAQRGPLKLVDAGSPSAFYLSLQIGPTVVAYVPIGGVATRLKGRWAFERGQVESNDRGEAVLKGPNGARPDAPLVAVHCPAIAKNVGPFDARTANGWITRSNDWVQANQASRRPYAGTDVRAAGSLARQILVTDVREAADEQPPQAAARVGSQKWVADFVERLGSAMSDNLAKAIAGLKK